MIAIGALLCVAELLLFSFSLLFFGAAFKVNFAVASKDQAASIRPVYVGAVNNDETKALDAANFGPFQHILKDDARFY